MLHYSRSCYQMDVVVANSDHVTKCLRPGPPPPHSAGSQWDSCSVDSVEMVSSGARVKGGRQGSGVGGVAIDFLIVSTAGF